MQKEEELGTSTSWVGRIVKVKNIRKPQVVVYEDEDEIRIYGDSSYTGNLWLKKKDVVLIEETESTQKEEESTHSEDVHKTCIVHDNTIHENVSNPVLPPAKVEGWEEEFDSRFPILFYLSDRKIGENETGIFLEVENDRRKKEAKLWHAEAKKFISQALATQKAEFRKMVQKMTIKNPQCDCRTYSLGDHECEFTSNEAIRDILSRLEEL